MLDERRFDNYVAEVLIDSDVAVEDVFDNRLIVVDTTRQEAQQIVVAPAHQVALDHLVDLGDLFLENPEMFPVMVRQRDLGEDRCRLPELREIDVGMITDYVTGLFQPLDALQAGTRRQRNSLGQIDVRDASRPLQLGQDSNVNAIKLVFEHTATSIDQTSSDDRGLSLAHASDYCNSHTRIVEAPLNGKLQGRFDWQQVFRAGIMASNVPNSMRLTACVQSLQRVQAKYAA